MGSRFARCDCLVNFCIVELENHDQGAPALDGLITERQGSKFGQSLMDERGIFIWLPSTLPKSSH